MDYLPLFLVKLFSSTPSVAPSSCLVPSSCQCGIMTVLGAMRSSGKWRFHWTAMTLIQAKRSVWRSEERLWNNLHCYVIWVLKFWVGFNVALLNSSFFALSLYAGGQLFDVVSIFPVQRRPGDFSKVCHRDKGSWRKAQRWGNSSPVHLDRGGSRIQVPYSNKSTIH